jgi:hypothetical protein
MSRSSGRHFLQIPGPTNTPLSSSLRSPNRPSITAAPNSQRSAWTY